MTKVQVEFINTCPCCDAVGCIVKEVAGRYGEAVEVKLYAAGKDFDYLKKYGMISKGTMIINGKTKYDTLNREIIETVIDKAVKETYAD
jgi:hypothetical protein